MLNPATEYVAKFTEEIDKARVVHAGTLARADLSADGDPVAAGATIHDLARQIVDDARETIPVVSKDGAIVGGLDRKQALDILLGAA